MEEKNAEAAVGPNKAFAKVLCAVHLPLSKTELLTVWEAAMITVRGRLASLPL